MVGPQNGEVPGRLQNLDGQRVPAPCNIQKLRQSRVNSQRVPLSSRPRQRLYYAKGVVVGIAKKTASIGIVNAKELEKRFNKLHTDAEKAVNSTVKDFKSRAPSWVSDAVREKYNIKAQEIKPKTASGKANKVRYAGSIFVSGDTLDSAVLEYKGRLLTPTHFSMTPKAPKDTYKLSVKIMDGQRKKLGGKRKLTKKQKLNIGRNFTHQGVRHARRDPIMLFHTGAKSEDKISHIPMKIKSDGKFEAIKTLSLPQMVDNESVRAEIDATVKENIEKRLSHHMQRFLK